MRKSAIESITFDPPLLRKFSCKNKLLNDDILANIIERNDQLTHVNLNICYGFPSDYQRTYKTVFSRAKYFEIVFNCLNWKRNKISFDLYQSEQVSMYYDLSLCVKNTPITISRGCTSEFAVLQLQQHDLDHLIFEDYENRLDDISDALSTNRTLKELTIRRFGKGDD